jgi:hypothetical protein
MKKSRLIQIIKYRNKVLFEFLSDNFSIILIVFLLALIGFWISIKVDSLKEFGQNFLSEMLGVLVTILVINQLIVYRDEKRKLPHKFAVYDDIRLFISSYMVFWQQAFQESVPEDDPENIYSFFSDDGMGKIWNFLDITVKPKSAIPCSWYDHLIEFSTEYREKGDKILTRHSKHLPPEIYRIIHQITEAHYLDVLINMHKMTKYYENSKIDVSNVLESYAVVRPNDKDYSSIIALHEWCENIHQELSSIEKTISRVTTYIPRKNKPIPPPAMTPDKEKIPPINRIN